MNTEQPAIRERRSRPSLVARAADGIRHTADGRRPTLGGRGQEAGDRGRRHAASGCLRLTNLKLKTWGAYGRRREAGGAETPKHRNTAPPARSAFTLIELLVTVALIAVLSALMAPAVRGLLGVTGPRGGVNTLTAAIEQTRLTAMENGVNSFLGLPVDEQGISDEERYSSFIVFREKRPDEETENDRTLIPVTRWLRLPQGVYLEVEDLQLLVDSPSIESKTLPKLGEFDFGGGGGSTMKVLSFDRFGKLHENESEVVSLRVGAKQIPDRDFDDDDAYFRIEIAPLTGRASVSDVAREREDGKDGGGQK